jgi:ATP-binding cassette, subfamily B, bacterial CvaB/MchF/RaxB
VSTAASRGGLHLGLNLGSRRLPLWLQTEAAECGLACLGMVAAYHGHRSDLPTARQRFSVSANGSTLADLVRMAGQLRLDSRALRVELSELSAVKLPCILHWDLNHFVVLKQLRGNTAVIHDPAHGVRSVRIESLSAHFTGVVLELTPQVDFVRCTERQRVTLGQLLGHVSGLKRSLAQVLVLALALEFFMLLAPFFMQWVVDGVLVSADRELLLTLVIGFSLLVVVQVAVGAIRSWAVLHLSASLNLQWVGNVFSHLMRLPMSWFEKRHVGDVQSRFGAVQQIQQTLTTSFSEALLDGLLVVLTLTMMLVYSPTLSAIAVLAVLAYAGLRWAFYRPLREASEEAIVHDAKRASHFLESVRGAQTIRLFNAQAGRQARFMNLVVDAMNAHIATRKLDLLFGTAHKLLFGLERVAVVWIGALLVLDGHFSVGMLFAFLAYKEQFATRVSGLIDRIVELSMLRLQGERLADIVLSAPEVEPVAVRRAEPNAPLIELCELRFAYADGEHPVIDGLNLSIGAGESVAIVGPSGCGKTTLLKLMIGVHAPQQGTVRVAGVDLKQLGLGHWRDMLGTVMQDDQLFAGSITDNISFFAADPDPAWVEECARLACVHDDIIALPMAYHTLLGDMAVSLSGGQRQRLLLARALYKRPQVLFLDEATSALDIDRERDVNHAIRQLPLTRVIVAHRPETIASAHRVVVLGEGRITQDLRSMPAGAGVVR